MFKNRESIDEFIALNGIKIFLDLMILDGEIKLYEHKGLKITDKPKHIMTRAEAIACFTKHMATPSATSAERIIDFYIAAGMLEVKKEEDKTIGLPIGLMIDFTKHKDWLIFVTELNKQGYKITEK